MGTHELLRRTQVHRALGGLLILLVSMSASTRVAARADPAVVPPPGGWTLQPACDAECGFWHVSGEAYVPQPSVVASPAGTRYSVSHRVGADIDGSGPQPITCFFIFDPSLPGAADDIVTFDAAPEAIRTDLLGTVPTVTESDTAQPNGLRIITIQTQSPPGTDLFPRGFQFGGVQLTDACFSIGVDPGGDPLTWAGVDTINAATIEFLKDGVRMAGPFDATSFLPVPWTGVVSITLPGGAGQGFNGVRFAMQTAKSINLLNDGCRDQIEVTDGAIAFSTIGATTDGPSEPTACNFNLYSDIGSDIWYRYTATCTGNLTVDLCNSNYDTKLAVYDGCRQCPVSSSPLGCNDDACGLRSRVTVPSVQGHCYAIRVGGYLAEQGTGTLTVSCNIIPPPTGACCDAGACLGTFTASDCQARHGAWFEGTSCPSFVCPVSPPANDACTDCIRVLTGVPYQGRTRAATGTDVSSCATNDTLDVWNCWTADCTGSVSINTCGSSFDTTLAVYDACGGHEIACDDDGCEIPPPPPQQPRQSMVTLDVVEGTTYTIRVAGYNGNVGNYTLNVGTCKNACCLSSGFCGLATPSECAAAGGTYLGPGSLCRGDQNNNGIDDACELCPRATVAGAAPPDGTVDARQPNARNAPLPRQGIGSPGGPGTSRESIVLVLNPGVPDATGCFSLCETRTDSALGANAIQSVTYHGTGVYELVLNHAISTGGVTTIEYVGDGSFIDYTSHPANVDASNFADASDVQQHMDCCLSGLCTPVWGMYSCDIDRSTMVTPADTLAVIDLLNGAQVWDIWFGSPLPTRGTCP